MLAGRGLRAEALRDDLSRLRVDQCHPVRVPEFQRLRFELRHPERMIDVGFGEFSLDFESVTGHVELERRIGHSFSPGLVPEALVFGLVDRGYLGQADTLLLFEVLLILLDEGVGDDQLRGTFLLLLQKQFIDARLQQFKLSLFITHLRVIR